MVHPPLTDVEVRILGSLVEKEATTPDNYPLSLSVLAAACNQTSNRDPVMRLDEGVISEAIVPLRRRSLVRSIQPMGSRVTKYQHLLADVLNLDRRELAVLDVLMLRGPQTAGEIFGRTGRLAEFGDIAAVEGTLDRLVARDDGALVTRLPRRPGQREERYAHLLSGEVTERAAESPAAAEQSGPAPAFPSDRVASLERTVDALRAELTALREEFAAFRAQFQ